MSVGIREAIARSLKKMRSITEKIELCVLVIGIGGLVRNLAVILFHPTQAVKSSVRLRSITCKGNYCYVEQLKRLYNFPNKGVYIFSPAQTSDIQSYMYTHALTHALLLVNAFCVTVGIASCHYLF